MITYSGVIPVYKNDQKEYLEVAVNSLLNQTKPLLELILVVEGKDLNDDVEVYLNDIQNRVIICRIPDQKGPLNFGLPATLNYGIKVAKGDFIVRLDSDDYSLPNRLEIIDEYLRRNPNLELVGSWVDEYDEHLKSYISTRKVPADVQTIRKKGVWKNPFNGPTVVFNRKTALELGGYPIVASNEDYCFWAEFIVNNSLVANINESLVRMRTGESMIPRRQSRRYRMGTVQSNAYLYSIGFFNVTHFIWHSIINSIVRRLPLRLFYFIQFRLFRI